MPAPRSKFLEIPVRLLNWIGQHEIITLVSVGIVVAGLWAFVELAGEVMENDTEAFDRRILLAMRNPDDLTDPLGPRWLEEMLRDFTALGGIAVLTILTLATTGFLALQRKYHAALLIIAAVFGGMLISTALKYSFSRDRPDLVPHGSEVYTASFPSGHSMMAAVTYLTLGALLARTISQFRIKAYLIIVAVLLTILVGISRVYLGVHWPTDVFAGWTIGVAWATLCSLIARRLQARGAVEQPAEVDEEPQAPAPV